MTSSKSQWDEVQKELLGMLVPGQWLTLEPVHAPISHVYSLSIRDDECPGSGLIIVADKELMAKLRGEEIPYRSFTIVVNEQLLAKLRSINGQFVHEGLPIFYYEHLSKGGPSGAGRIH